MTDLTEEFPFGAFTCKDCGKEAPRKSNRGRAPERCDACKAKKKSDESVPRLNKLRQGFGRIPLHGSTANTEADIAEVLEAAHAEAIEEIHKEEDVAAEENEAATDPENFRMKVDEEPTWLDDPEAQELLRQKNEAITAGMPPPEDGETIGDYLARVAQIEVDRDQLVSDPELDALIAESDAAGGLDGLDSDDLPPPEPGEGVGSYIARVTGGTVVDTTVDLRAPSHAVTPLCVVPSCGIPNPPHVQAFCPNHWQQVGLEERNVLLGVPVNSETFKLTVRRALAKMS